VCPYLHQRLSLSSACSLACSSSRSCSCATKSDFCKPLKSHAGFPFPPTTPDYKACSRSVRAIEFPSSLELLSALLRAASQEIFESLHVAISAKFRGSVNCNASAMVYKNRRFNWKLKFHVCGWRHWDVVLHLSSPCNHWYVQSFVCRSYFYAFCWQQLSFEGLAAECLAHWCMSAVLRGRTRICSYCFQYSRTLVMRRNMIVAAYSSQRGGCYRILFGSALSRRNSRVRS